MNSFKTFMNIFERAVSRRDSNTLIDILVTGGKYVQNISKDESELVLSILFDKDKGLLAFLNSELKRDHNNRGFDTAIKEGFNFLLFVMHQFPGIFVPYIIDIKNTCQTALLMKCSAYIRNAACNVFKDLIEKYNGYDLQLGDTINTFVSKFDLLDIKERNLVFSVLGTIIRHNSKLPELETNVNIIFQQLKNDFKKQFNPETMSKNINKNIDKNIDIFAVYMDVLSNSLINLPQSEISIHSEELYKWIKELCNPARYTSRKVTLRAAIEFIGNNIQPFHESIYDEYEYWHEVLLTVARDKDVRCQRVARNALKRFYEEAGSIFTNTTSEDDKNDFMYFINFFEDQLKNNSNENSSILRFIANGYSQMAAASKQHFGNNKVREMFSLIAYHALTICSRDDLEQDHLEGVSNYQDALSHLILHVGDLSLDQINVIIKLSILLIKKYPDLSINGRGSVISSFVNTVLYIGRRDKNMLDEFLYHLIHDGVTWTCSHILSVDASLRKMNSSEEPPVCYKDYLYLWSQILTPCKYRQHLDLVQQVADTMMHVGIVLISKLNLNTRTKEDSAFSDAAFTQIAENPVDFRTFVNIVDLYVDILSTIDYRLLPNTVQKFILKIISMSYKHPLISGFYKLMRVIFDYLFILVNDIDAEVIELSCKYLTDVLHLIPTFSNELLTTCLYLILNTPTEFVKPILNNMIPTFKIALTIGLSDFELARATLDALQTWTSKLEKADTSEFLREIVPYLELHLQSGETSAEFLQDILKTERKVIKRIVLKDSTDSLEKFQMKILLFMASLDTDITLDFIYKRSMNVGATWDKKDLLKYSLMLSDTELDIYFDQILPRLMLLAQNSGDRRTKISACEVLHSLVSFILGKTSQNLATNANKFVSIYAILYPALLNLGCDFDETARNLFQPLILQLTHWLSSKFMLKSPATVYFLDSLFSSLSNESNSSLREFSGICLAEFTRWSIKQSDDDRVVQSNIDEVMYKMTNFALHPSMFKRIAAATAFNHLYTILREDEKVVTTYWLEILYCFVKSLDGCNDISIVTALNHVERVLVAKKDLLNYKNKHRKKPQEFEDTTLTDAVNWLLVQCGCLDQNCRAKCMEFVVKFSPCLTDCDSAKTMIQNYIDTHGIEAFNNIILKNLKTKADSLSVDGIMPLLRSLDCYIWLMRNDLVDAQLLFGASNSRRETIFNCAKNFLHLMNRVKIEKGESNVTALSEEFAKLQTLQCKALTTMFDFLQILLSFDEDYIPDFFFNKDLYKLIARCVMCPQTIGFNVKNLEIIEALPSVMGRLLRSITRKTDNWLWNLIRHELSIYATKQLNHFLDFNTIFRGLHDRVTLKQYVRGLILLEQHDLLGQLDNVTTRIKNPEIIVEEIFNIITGKQKDKVIFSYVRTSTKNYLEILMEFLFIHYKPSMMKVLITLIKNDTKILRDAKAIKCGIYFLHTFKNEILKYLLTDPDQTVQLLVDELQGDATLLLTIMEQLFLFARQHKKEFPDETQSLVNSAIRRFALFEGVINNFTNRKEKVISIFGIAVHLMTKPTEVSSLNQDLYTWILGQLTEYSDIKQKIHILQNFLICLTDTTSGSKPELLVILRNLKTYRLNVSPDDFEKKNIKAMEMSNCFQTLLSLLPVTKSVVAFETAILFAAGIAEQLCNERTNECLQKYFTLITTEYKVESVTAAYKLFMKLNTPTKDRLDILHKFLLPSFQYCETTEVRRFFEQNIKEIYTIICLSLVGCSSDIMQLAVSKIGCYNLVTIMFAKLDARDIGSAESAITKNAIADVVTGKELVQKLYSNVLKVRMLKSPDPEHKEIIRLLHCSAYNCSITMVSSLKRDEDSYLGIFAENRKNEQLIWENILDCQKQYRFQQVFDERPRFSKKVINIRRKMKQRKSEQHSYLYNCDFSTCSLIEDINAYDFNETVVQNAPRDNEESMSLTFESDELNNHECMASICGVLTYMKLEKISLPCTDEDTMPRWLRAFLNSMEATDHDAVRLFMLKIIFNVDSVFKPYMKFLVDPIMYVIYVYLKRNQLNYIILDVIEMLMGWQLENAPDIEFREVNGKLMVQYFWEIMIKRVIVERTREMNGTVYNYNMRVVQLILQLWRSRLKVPDNLEAKMNTAPVPAIFLIYICLINGMESIASRANIIEFLEKSLERWQENENTILQTFECLGFILNFAKDNEALTNRIIEKIRNTLREMQTKLESRQIKCIHSLCRNYPRAAMVYFEFIPANVFKLDALGKANCLEIFLHCIPNFSPSQISKELAHIKFTDLLQNKVAPCEEVALKIINALVPVYSPSDILPLANLIPPYTRNESSKYRETSYDIFINIYKKYAPDISEDNSVKELMLLSTEILINGVLDPGEALQNKVLNFWTQNAQLTSTCKERLLEILAKYTPNVGNNFLPFVLLILLDLATKSNNYATKLFEPLQNCTYRDYKIALSWRMKNLGSKAPLFAPSMVSQMNSMFTQLPNTFTAYSSNAQLKLRATQEPEFEPTYVEEEYDRSSDLQEHLEDYDVQDHETQDAFDLPVTAPQPSFYKRCSPRFLKNPTDVSDAFREREIKKNKRRVDMIKEEGARQRGSIKLYRRYRIGDFPDIEISHATLLEPLKQLATKDQLICKDLVASIVRSLLEKCRESDFIEQIAYSLKGIVANGQGSSIVSAILEISLSTRAIDCSPEVIAKVSRFNGLNFLGSLALEENIIYGANVTEPPNKKARTGDTNDSSNEWLQLTNLYQSMNNVDVVLSIFQNHITDEDIRTASFSQLSNNWLKAKMAYEKAYEAESESIKEHCLQSLFECLSNLCCWDEVDKRIKNRLNGDINNIWEHPWKDWMLPWLIEAFARKLVSDNYDDAFEDDINAMKTWLNDEAKLKDIKRFFGEELAMFFMLNSCLEASTEFLINTLDQMREDWIGLHPLSTQLRIGKLQKLRIISDVDQYIKTLKSLSDASELESAMKFWRNSLPSSRDCLLLWDKLTSYRTYFIKLVLDNKTGSNEPDSMDSELQEEENVIKNKLQVIIFNMGLKMVEASLEQKQRYIAKKYLKEIEVNKPPNEDCLNQFLLAGAKYKYLIGELETVASKRFSSYVSSWKHCHELLQKDGLSPATGIGVRRQISTVASRLVKLSEEDETFSSLLMRNEDILRGIQFESCDLPAIKASLERYSFDNLMICCDTSTSNKDENYYAFAKYCYEKLSRGAEDVQLIRGFVRFTLKAMEHGSSKAAHYFPCLLKSEYFADRETKDIFTKYSENVPTWLFLSWQAQLFSNLATSIAPLILPILKRIADTYPNAIIYTFHLTMETNSVLMNDARTYDIRQILYNRPWIGRFLEAMQYVVQPELYLQHYLAELLKNLPLGTSTAINMFMNKVYPNVHGSRDSIKPGSIFNEIVKYKNQIKELENKKPDEIKRQVARLMETVKESLNKRKNRFKLADYNSWLCDFSDKDIEIPGQYTGDRRPVPQNHVKIMRIEPTVMVMQSIRRPIRITILGNDGKEYHFLVKFGEDLRQDQRLQQLFSTMNKILQSDPACAQRHLSVDTYQVIPLSRTVGLIQWVNNTRSLQETIHYTLTKQEENRYNSIPKEYTEWIRHASTSRKQHEWYKEAVMKYSSSRVTSKMKELISKTKWDGLRKTFSVLCTSVESFVTMRQNFVISYATMCIAHWILGIGDRHLENTLINIDSGRCLGIDFGLAFDASVDQSVPELMPFRLTPQILGLLKPFTEKDLLGALMIHTLRAIRNEQGPVLSCMDVFVHEPLNWTEHINKTLRENEEDVTDVKWMPMKKIEAVMKKLNGIKPSLITLDQLKEQHNDQYFDKYCVIVTGDDDVKQTRAKMKDNFLTPEEQVECLLDQATDLNILGRTYVGWKPWL